MFDITKNIPEVNIGSEDKELYAYVTGDIRESQRQYQVGSSRGNIRGYQKKLDLSVAIL
ncbi:MAG: hypothetical protein GY749_16015 [Desulfobacteraceae bacterium]|nr:hypothetical protein [Desulfobacteraceae bacterium]